MLEIIQDLTGWEKFAYTYVAISIVANVIFTVVVITGGFFDLVYMFKELKKEQDTLHGEDLDAQELGP